MPTTQAVPLPGSDEDKTKRLKVHRAVSFVCSWNCNGTRIALSLTPSVFSNGAVQTSLLVNDVKLDGELRKAVFPDLVAHYYMRFVDGTEIYFPIQINRELEQYEKIVVSFVEEDET